MASNKLKAHTRRVSDEANERARIRALRAKRQREGKAVSKVKPCPDDFSPLTHDPRKHTYTCKIHGILDQCVVCKGMISTRTGKCLCEGNAIRKSDQDRENRRKASLAVQAKKRADEAAKRAELEEYTGEDRVTKSKKEAVRRRRRRAPGVRPLVPSDTSLRAREGFTVPQAASGKPLCLICGKELRTYVARFCQKHQLIGRRVIQMESCGIPTQEALDKAQRITWTTTIESPGYCLICGRKSTGAFCIDHSKDALKIKWHMKTHKLTVHDAFKKLGYAIFNDIGEEELSVIQDRERERRENANRSGSRKPKLGN